MNRDDWKDTLEGLLTLAAVLGGLVVVIVVFHIIVNGLRATF